MDTTDFELVQSCDKEWQFQHVGKGIRGKYSAWCKLRARQEVIDQRDLLDPMSYKECLASVNEQIAAGAYSWGSPLNPKGMGTGVFATINGDEGRVYLLMLLLERKHGKLTVDDIAAIVEGNTEGVRLALDACLEVPSLKPKEGDDPNAKAPANPGTTNGTSQSTAVSQTATS
jgi:hypothetical protein